MTVRIITGDCRDALATLPDASVHCCVSSPPYFGLRDYGHAGQMGLEPTPDEYVAGMVGVFREVRRILRDDGVCFLNIGDSYASGNMLPQQYHLREDLTDDQRTAAVVAMFGVRFDEHLEAGQWALQEVLPSELRCEAICDQSSLESGRVQGELPAEQNESIGENAGATAGAEVGSFGSAGRKVRVLQRDAGRVSDGRSHQRRRRSASETTDGEKPCKLDQSLQGHSEARVSERSVSRPLLQLQLRDRLVGILSSRTFAHDEISAAASSYFRRASELKPKDLIGIPWMLAFALRADGWYLRQDIIWSKPNPMPESVRDRCTKAHEYIFMLSKSPRYFYDQDAIAEPAIYSGLVGQDANGFKNPMNFSGKHAANPEIRGERITNNRRATQPTEAQAAAFHGNPPTNLARCGDSATRNKRSVWEVATQPFSEAHFATFPPALIEPCILAGCPSQCCSACGAPFEDIIEGTAPDGRKAILVNGRTGRDEDGKALIGNNMTHPGEKGSFNAAKGVIRRETIGSEPSCKCGAGIVSGTALDPFGGAGTTGLVADRLQRNAILIELNPEYAAMAQRRIADEAGMFGEVMAA